MYIVQYGKVESGGLKVANVLENVSGREVYASCTQSVNDSWKS